MDKSPSRLCWINAGRGRGKSKIGLQSTPGGERDKEETERKVQTHSNAWNQNAPGAREGKGANSGKR